MAFLDWVQSMLGGTSGQGPMMRQDAQGNWGAYQPPPYKSALDQLYELAGGEDLSGAYKAYQRGEYLPAFGQGAAGTATALGTAIPAFRAGGAVARAAAPIAREAAVAFPGLLADEAGALRLRAAKPEPWQPAAPGIIRTPESPIDYRGINMAERPDVPQFPLERPSYARSASEAKWNALDNPQTWDRYQEAARIGLPEGRWGGREWYNTLPLLRAFLEINPSGGERDFRRFIDYVGASSPGNPVPQNIRTASYLYHADKQGLDLPPLYRTEKGAVTIYPDDARAIMFPKDAAGNKLPSNLSSAEIQALMDQFGLPTGYGGYTQGGWIEHAKNLRMGNDFDLMRNPKPPSFVQNLMGNYEPFTIDRHNMRVITGWDPKKGFPPGFADAPPPEAYGILERLQQRYARDLNLHPAQTQAATWLGGETGVKSSLVQPFAGEFEQKLYEAAARYGIPPKELMRDFVLGNRPL
jgi:hypothetical protein